MILVILAGLSTFAMLAAWLLRVDSTSLWPLGEQGREGFWRRTLPWPRGVQEDAEIAWHVPRPAPTAAAPRAVAIGTAVPPTRPQRRMGSR
jgi:hypothetical protein